MTQITPINKRLIVKSSSSLMRGTIAIPDTYRDAATSCVVSARGPKVTQFIRQGDVVLCEVGFDERRNGIPGTRQFWCDESNIYAVIKDKKIYPLGRHVLVRRDMQEKELDSGIIIPANRRFQSLDGYIVRLGLSAKHFKVSGLKVGLKIRLTNWEPHMREVTLEDGSYGLIVNDTDLLFQYEHNNH